MNIDADLSPFLGIDPCGFANLAVTSTQELGISHSKSHIMDRLVQEISKQLTVATSSDSPTS